MSLRDWAEKTQLLCDPTVAVSTQCRSCVAISTDLTLFAYDFWTIIESLSVKTRFFGLRRVGGKLSGNLMRNGQNLVVPRH